MKKAFSIFLVMLVVVSIFAATSTVRISAKKISGKKDSVFLTGDVYIEKEGDVSLTTDTATMTAKNGSWNHIETAGLTHVNFSSGDATSMNMVYDLDISKGTLLHNVSAVFNDDTGKRKIMIKNAKKLDFDLNKKEYSGESLPKNAEDFKPLEIQYKDELTANSLYFEYSESTGIILLEGDVFVNDIKNKRKIYATKLYYNTNDDSFEGENVSLEMIFEED
ncbi:hypothetical protein AT15_06085 [Kosmotoga arenicorallina S304]|uniref:Organic solvent tolerance-like N-terminal domain-containing protein n=1 Tax=Kosmotoga arenicorallina S304 TaxID=1453497 RepID=A0A176K2W2_9BACT|nr:LptA/OstA family protein [Kosmotoga arenicorallina]OAA31640.1 hypothetical protein AT15_06085 [Kosmotoga arenicorallina S304]